MSAGRRSLLVWLAVAPLWPAAAWSQNGTRRVIEARIQGRAVVAPLGSIKVTEGEVVALRWTSDESVELHVHGYDLKLQLEAGEPATLEVEAFATGRFPVMSHGWGAGGHGHEALIYLEVHPR